MRGRLVAMVIAAVLVPLTSAPAAQSRSAATTLSIDEIIIGPSTGGTQTIHITGDVTQDISVTFALGKPPSFLRGEGVDGAARLCHWLDGVTLLCEGTGDVGLWYSSALEDETAYSVEVATPDGAYALGSVHIQIPADVEVRGATYVISERGTVARLEVAVRNLGPYEMRGQVLLSLKGLDASLGVPTGCETDGNDVVCFLSVPYNVLGQRLEFPVPVCTVVRQVTINAVPFQVDPNWDNNGAVVPGQPAPAGCTPGSDGGGSGGGGSGGEGSGGGGSGGGGSGGDQPPATSPAVDATPSPTMQTPTAATTRATAPTSAGTAEVALPETRSGSGLLAGGIGAIVALSVGALLWWRHHRARPAHAPGSPSTVAETRTQ